MNKIFKSGKGLGLPAKSRNGGTLLFEKVGIKVLKNVWQGLMADRKLKHKMK